MNVVAEPQGLGGMKSAWKAVDDSWVRVVDRPRPDHLSHPDRVVGDRPKTTFQDATFRHDASRRCACEDDESKWIEPAVGRDWFPAAALS